MTRTLEVDNLKISIYENTKSMGSAAATFTAEILNKTIAKKGFANLILATGASQFSMLEALKEREIDWQKITVFHLDEYKGITDQHSASFRKYLKERILDDVAPKKIYFLQGDAEDLHKEMNNYAEQLKNTLLISLVLVLVKTDISLLTTPLLQTLMIRNWSSWLH